jgi:hypothetical protein
VNVSLGGELHHKNIALAALIYFAFALASFAWFQKQRTVGERSMAFLLFAVGSVIITLWVVGLLEMLMGEAAAAWIFALLAAGGISIVRRSRSLRGQ